MFLDSVVFVTAFSMVSHASAQHFDAYSSNQTFSSSMDIIQSNSAAEGSNICHTRHFMDLLGAANEYSFHSLSNSSSSFAIDIGNSSYLKPARSLLEEIASVSDKAIEASNERYVEKFCGGGTRSGTHKLSDQLKAELYNKGGSSTDNDDLRAQLARLIHLLEEVEWRYEKYYNQMGEIVSSFELISGAGSAKAYTGLALHAMSKHFSSLRDAIVLQIDVARRKISPDSPKLGNSLSQLSLLERETNNRHNSRMSLQQLGMMQNQRQTWRPIRGLPESSVAVLRSWLFEHFLHPYPNDSEKLMLSSQTSLTKNQVSNWFINARVRLWKPMIEAIYKEEFADSSEDSNPTIL